MAQPIAWDQDAVRQRARALLSVSDRVKDEGWDDWVAAQLRQAACELMAMVSDSAAPQCGSSM